MRRLWSTVVLIATSGATYIGCKDDQLLPTETANFMEAGMPAAPARINKLIRQVFTEKADRNAAKNLFSRVKDNLEADDIETAQRLTFELIDMVRAATGRLDRRATLIDELQNFSGIGGVAAVIGSAGGDLMSPDKQAAVSFPAGALLEDEIISIHPKAQPCFPTSQVPAAEQFDFCYSFEPSRTFESDVRIEVCLALPESHDDYNTVQLHSRDEGGALSELPSVQHQLVDCPSSVASAETSTFEQFVRAGVNRIANLVLPEPLIASVGLAPRGLGGLKGSFSDFGWAMPQEQADLVIESVSISSTSQDNPVTITATIANEGIGNSGAFDVEANVEQGGDVHLLEKPVAGLGAGASTAVVFVIPDCSLALTGFYSLRLTADVNGEVSESDEGNNVLANVLFSVSAGSCS